MQKFKVSFALVLFSYTSIVSAAEYTIKLITANANGQMMLMEPGYLKVEKGDTVNFVPADATHNAVSFSIPAGAESFATPMGEPTKVVFGRDGVYIYKCVPHSTLGMVGVIQVGKAVNLEQAKKEGAAFNAAVVMNKTRLTDYLSQVK
ncbi:MAG: hypothetical protein KUG72_09020 [Pseudomonadales bacterium]|nr:hypothetical protein [Pseudomonadales bacterium]